MVCMLYQRDTFVTGAHYDATADQIISSYGREMASRAIQLRLNPLLIVECFIIIISSILEHYRVQYHSEPVSAASS